MTDKTNYSGASKSSLPPRDIVKELDRYIVGQSDAKKTVAIALRNRYRRKKVEEFLRDEIVPKNILMVGPTGVGKTEIARRLAKIVGAPFIKVEATKFTEVGYVGRDVESVIRDLLQNAIIMIKDRYKDQFKDKASKAAREKIITNLVGSNASIATKEKFREMYEKGHLDDKEIEIEVKDGGGSLMPTMDIPGMPGSQMGVLNVSDMLGKAFGGGKKKKKKLNVKDAFRILVDEEMESLVDEDKIVSEAIQIVEEDGIVFLDEIDKIASNNNAKGGEVSREGVQRDLLPLIEGTTVATKHGSIKTDHILFVSSGAFYSAKPSDLLPELQGRFPLRVELQDLSTEDLVRILEEPEASLIKQYIALMEADGVKLKFEKSAINKIAEITASVNRQVENIGARRLHTLMEKLLEEISFDADKNSGKTIKINEKYVTEKLESVTTKMDLSKFIL
ncbi:MAG: ATP-dependent protease ATPase subunit HslU [Rickettsiales bacterium]